MPKRVKISEELEEAEEPISLTVSEPIVDEVSGSPEQPPLEQQAAPEQEVVAVKPKKPLSEARLAALSRAREKAKENARIRRLLKDGEEPNAEAQPKPEAETPPPPPPKAAPAKAKRTKKEINDEKADKVLKEAKAKSKKIASAPMKKPAKLTSPAEKSSKENARRVKEGEAMKKAEFEARVARQVQAELKRQKALERLEAEEAEERENERTAPPEQHQTRVVPQRQATAPPKPKKNPNVYEFMHDGEPAYVRMQKRGDSFMERLMAQAAMRNQ